MLNEKTVKMGQKIRYDRVRGGKIQRKKIKSAKAGFKVSGKKIVKMSPAEKRRRKLSAKKSVRKRAAKLSSILRKRKISITRGKRAGLYK
jgi:hypothetical protein